MAYEVLFYISLVIGVAALATIIARVIRQPPIIAYLFAGVLVGPMFLGLIDSSNGDYVQLFARMGVALLLFIVGLSLDFRVLKEVGKVSTLAGLGEIIVTSLAVFGVSIWLGFTYQIALYLAAALAFSSTVVVVKILSDKKEIDTLHGKIALGILIVEDFVAALVLMVIPLLNGSSISMFILGFIKIIGLIFIIFIFSSFILNKLMDYLARSQETLFLFGIAWALALAALFNYLGLSLEIGALIAGMSLASSKYNLELGGKIKPLRDFFVVLLFVFFGSQLVGPISTGLIVQAIAFSFLILVGKPFIVMGFLRFFGYKKRTNFLAGSALAQISEFSLVIVLMGLELGYLNQEFMNLAVLIALITIGISSYNIYYSRAIYGKVGPLLHLFDGNLEEKDYENLGVYDVVLFGHHRIGYKILERLKQIKAKVLVVDYNPKVILSLEKQGVDYIYGDAADKNFLAELRLGKAKLIISTVNDESANIAIKEILKEVESKATFIATAEQPRAAMDLYDIGADYVIIPHHLGGDYVSHLIDKFGNNYNKFKDLGKSHMKELIKAREESSF
jgi:Kef-type K+ transport system membrane component KefB